MNHRPREGNPLSEVAGREDRDVEVAVGGVGVWDQSYADFQAADVGDQDGSGEPVPGWVVINLDPYRHRLLPQVVQRGQDIRRGPDPGLQGSGGVVEELRVEPDASHDSEHFAIDVTDVDSAAPAPDCQRHCRRPARAAHRPADPDGLERFRRPGGLDAMVAASAGLRALAVPLRKIANDIRWLASGPRCGISELILPANEPGSSIMPGKVNPTQCEAMVMVWIQVLSEDTCVAFAGSQGNFELNAMRPIIINNVLHSALILGDACEKLREYCIVGTELNTEKIAEYVDRSLMLVTALSPVIGYDQASPIAHRAQDTGSTLREAALASGTSPLRTSTASSTPQPWSAPCHEGQHPRPGEPVMTVGGVSTGHRSRSPATTDRQKTEGPVAGGGRPQVSTGAPAPPPTSRRDRVAVVIHGLAVAVACLITFEVITVALAHVRAANSTDDLLGGMWAVVATVLTHHQSVRLSMSSARSRLWATGISFVLCLLYLLLLPFTAVGLAVLVGLGSVITAFIGRPEDAVTTGITTTVVMVVADLGSRSTAWEQPLLRVVDTVVGVAVGLGAAYLVRYATHFWDHIPKMT